MLDGTQAKYGDIMNDMNLMDELLKIPADATAATVQGIEMLLIDENKAGLYWSRILMTTPSTNAFLSNGRSCSNRTIPTSLPCIK